MRTNLLVWGMAALALFIIGCKKSRPLPSHPITPAELEQQATAMENMDFDSAFLMHEKALAAFERMPASERGGEYFNAILSTAKGREVKEGSASQWLDSLTHQNVLAFGEKHPPLAALYLQQGKYRLGNPDSALVFFQKAEKLLPTEELRATWQCRMGEYYLAKKEKRQAEDAFKWVLGRKNGLPAAPVSEAFWGWAELFPDSSLNCFQQVVTLNRQNTGSRFKLSQGFYELSVISHGQSDYQSFLIFADSAYYHAAAIFKTPCSHLENMCNLLANAYSYSGDFEKARQYFDQTILYDRQMSDSVLLARRFVNIGVFYRSQGKADSAVSFINKAIPFFEGKPGLMPRLLTALNNLGLAYMDAKDFALSEKTGQRALQLKKQNGSPHRDIATSYFNLAQLRNAQKDFQGATIYLDSTRHIFDTLEITEGVELSNLHNHYGWSYLGQKKHDLALQHFRLSVKAISPSFEMDKPDALPDLNEYLFDKIQLLYPLAGMGRVLSLQKKHALASAVYARAVELIDFTRSGFRAESSKQELMETARLVFEGAVENAVASGNCDEAFRLAEKSKAIVLSEAINSRELQFQNIPKKLLDEEAKRKADIAEKEKTLNEERQKKPAPNPQTINDLESEIVAKKSQLDAFFLQLKQEYPAYYDLKYNLSVASVEAVQSFLKQPRQDSTAVVGFFLGDSTLAAFGMDGHTFVCAQQTVGQQFRDDLKTLRRITSDSMPGSHGSEKWSRDFGKFMAVSRRLYDTLLGPVLPKLSSKRLVIIPDGELGYLPFHALVDKSPDAEILNGHDYGRLSYLFENQTIRYENSATLLLSNIPQKRWFSGGYAGFAPSYLAQKKSVPIADASINLHDLPAVRGNLAPLKYNVPEVEKCRTLWGGEGFYGPDASEKNFMEMSEKASVLHLSMHALTDDTEPAWSQLVFSETDDSGFDNHLHAYELYNMRLPTELAVLSACNTGNGRLAKGEGVQSLARAFRYAGCPSVLMTLWAANDLSTENITVGFFEKIKAGERKDDALKTAVGGYLHNKAMKSKSPKHPFFWAHYMLVGNEMPVQQGIPTWGFWAVGILILVGLLFFWRKRHSR